MTQERDMLLHDLKSNLLKDQGQMNATADKSRRDVTYAVGDWVYLKLQPYRLRALAKKMNEKLRPGFYGPYQICKRVGQVAYQLELPAEAKSTPYFTFHF